MLNWALGLQIHLSTKSHWIRATFSPQMLHFLLFCLPFQPLPHGHPLGVRVTRQRLELLLQDSPSGKFQMVVWFH